MPFTTNKTAYNIFASVLNKLNQKRDWELAIPILEPIFLQYIPDKAQILDLCCGSGQLANQLLKKGYQVTGLDISENLLIYARQNAPGGKFIQEDVRLFASPPNFHGIISIGVSLNHVMNIEDLEKVFHNVYGALFDNGIFLFDSRGEEWVESWETSINDATITAGYVEDDEIHTHRQIYEPENKVGRNFYTILQLIDGTWQRTDTSIDYKIYSTEEIISALEKAGFTEITTYDEGRDLGLDGETGKTCFVCRKAPKLTA